MIATAKAPSNRVQLTFFNLPVKETVTRFDKMRSTRMRNTAERNERIRKRFNYLYNEERKRVDDVITTLCTEFNLVKTTIERALKA